MILSKIEQKIKEFYLDQDIELQVVEENLDYLVGYFEIGDNVVEITTNINKLEILVKINNIVVKKVYFKSRNDYYFFFLKDISNLYFLKNLDFYTNDKIKNLNNNKNLKILKKLEINRPKLEVCNENN